MARRPDGSCSSAHLLLLPICQNYGDEITVRRTTSAKQDSFFLNGKHVNKSDVRGGVFLSFLRSDSLCALHTRDLPRDAPLLLWRLLPQDWL